MNTSMSLIYLESMLFQVDMHPVTTTTNDLALKKKT